MNKVNREIGALKRMKDEDIDLSDIPEMTGKEELVQGKFYHANPDGGLVSTCNLDGGSLPRGEPKPTPDYREPAIPPEQEKRLKDALGNHVLDYRLAFNQILVQFGGHNSESLAFKVAQLLRVNRELAIRLYGRPVDLEGIPVHPMWDV